MTKHFYGWWIVFAAFLTFGVAVGVPYYNQPFFYDYYMKPAAEGGLAWARKDIVLGFPLATLLLIWVGPLIVPRFSPRRLILIGTAFTMAAFFLWSQMGPSIEAYWLIWGLYAVGYYLSGPVVHQIIVSQWFRKRRGFAMGIVYVGVALLGVAGSLLIKPIAEADPVNGWRNALLALGAMLLIAWPIAWFVLKDKPAELGQFPDGADHPPAELKLIPVSFGHLFGSSAFWLLMIGSFCSIGSIGAINQHMKLVFKDQGFASQQAVNEAWQTANIVILISSIFGRLFVGWAADKLPKKAVMVSTYVLVSATIPLLLLVTPQQPMYIYAFAILFGFGMGADYMLIPLMAAEQFGVNSLARAMSVILPTDTIGQTWFPYGVAWLREHFGSYQTTLMVIFGLAFIGAVAIAMLPSADKEKNEALPLQDAAGAGAGRTGD